VFTSGGLNFRTRPPLPRSIRRRCPGPHPPIRLGCEGKPFIWIGHLSIARSRINYYTNQSTSIKTRGTRADVRLYQRSRRLLGNIEAGKCDTFPDRTQKPMQVGILKILKPFGLLRILFLRRTASRLDWF